MQCTFGCVPRQLDWYGVPCISNASQHKGFFLCHYSPAKVPHLLVTGTNHLVEFTDLPLQMVRFDPRPFHAGLVVDKLTL